MSGDNIDYEKLADTRDTLIAKRLVQSDRVLPSKAVWSFIEGALLILIPSALFWVSLWVWVNGELLPAAGFAVVGFVAWAVVFLAIEAALDRLLAIELAKPIVARETQYGSRRNRCLALLNSPDPTERCHIDFGLLDGTPDKPALISLPATQCHGLILGGSESGKTHRALLPIVWQILLCALTDGFSVRIHDLKGDEGEFHFTHSVCHQLGIPFDFITTDPRKFSMTLNPFAQRAWKLMSHTERVQIMAQALDLVPGGSWSSGYFADMIELMMDRFERTFTITSFKQALALLLDPRTLSKLKLTQKNYEHAGHFIAAINRMANIAPLNAEHSDIDLTRYYEETRCLYVFAPITLEPMSARVTSRLILHLDVATARIMTVRSRK